MPNENEDIFRGFGLAIRTFWAVGRGLSVTRSFKSGRFFDEAPEFGHTISGTGVSTEDDVCIIGTRIETKEFPLRIGSDVHAESIWKRHKGNDITQPSDTPQYRLRKLVHDNLDKSPPTASLGYMSADREVGLEAGWWLECDIPPNVLEQLVTDILEGRVHEISLGIKWEAGLVQDEHAPPNFPTTWGLYSMPEEGDGRSPEPLWGHVVSCAWGLRNERVWTGVAVGST